MRLYVGIDVCSLIANYIFIAVFGIAQKYIQTMWKQTSIWSGGSHIDMVYIYVPAISGTFAKFVIAIDGFHQRRRKPKLHKLGVF